MTTACLVPNGQMVNRGVSACTRLLVGTVKFVSILVPSPDKVWTVTDLTTEGRHISAFTLEPVNGGIYCGVHRGGGVFYSGDQGRTWESRGRGLTIDHVYSLHSTVENGRPVIYAGTEPVGFFRSFDEGRTWEELPTLR